MGIVMLEDVKKIVENFKENAPDGSIYLIVHKEFVDGIRQWLHDYVCTIKGKWLECSLKESFNETEIYVLHLRFKW